MIIDWHSHIYTPEEAAGDLGTLDGKNGPKWGERGCPMVLENFLDAHYANGIDISVVTNAAHYLRGKADHEELARGPEMDRLCRRSATEAQGHALFLRDRSCLRRPGFPQGGRAAIREPGSRASSFIPVTRVTIRTTTRRVHSGNWCRNWTCPVMIHPPHIGFGEERMKEYRLASSIGRPFDLCLALGRLIVRGILEEFPRVKIVASHGGGGICETISRMDYAYELQDEAFFLGSYAPMKIRHAPSHYLKTNVSRHRDLQSAGGENGAGLDGS